MQDIDEIIAMLKKFCGYERDVPAHIVQQFGEDAIAVYAECKRLITRVENKHFVDIERVRQSAELMIKVTNECYPSDPNDSWKNLHARQVLVDSLSCLKRHELIKEFDLVTGAVTVPSKEEKKRRNLETQRMRKGVNDDRRS